MTAGVSVSSLVALVLRANRAGRPPPEPWEEEDPAESDAKKFMTQLARLLPDHAEEIRELAFPPNVRVQLWCDTYACEFAKVVSVARGALKLPTGPCSTCGVGLNKALVYPFVFVHPNLFDVWTLEAPSLEAACERFASCWEARTREGGDFSHLTSSTFEQGAVQSKDDYEAP